MFKLFCFAASEPGYTKGKPGYAGGEHSFGVGKILDACEAVNWWSDVCESCALLCSGCAELRSIMTNGDRHQYLQKLQLAVRCSVNAKVRMVLPHND